MDQAQGTFQQRRHILVYSQPFWLHNDTDEHDDVCLGPQGTCIHPDGLWSYKFLFNLLLFLVGLDHANDDDDDDSDDWEDDDESDLPAVQPGEDRICHSNLATDRSILNTH